MQTFNTDHDAVFWTAENGEWVPAYVAQRLYDTLDDALIWIDDPEQERDVQSALAAADGEEV